MSKEALHTCPGCQTPNFTARGLKAHKCDGKSRAAALQVVGKNDDDNKIKGQQLTVQYKRATGGMQEVVIFGAMMMQLRSEHPELTQKGGDRRANSTRGVCPDGTQPLSLKKWLNTYAPEVKEATAYRFLHVTESIAENYAQIVGAKVAKTMPLPQLVTTQAAELPKGFEAKQLELFEFVNGTSQRSWLDRFSPQSPQKRGRDNRTHVKPKPKTAEELAQDAEDEIVNALNLLNAWLMAGHHLRVKAATRHTTEAALEGAMQKIRAVK